MFPGASCATVAILSLLLTVPVVTAEKCNTTCDSLTGWRDGFCDDENNNCGCDWDGGDCCRAHSNKKFCSDCLCLEPKDCHKWLCNPTDVTIVCDTYIHTSYIHTYMHIYIYIYIYIIPYERYLPSLLPYQNQLYFILSILLF